MRTVTPYNNTSFKINTTGMNAHPHYNLMPGASTQALN
jgi:hypothetical protein